MCESFSRCLEQIFDGSVGLSECIMFNVQSLP